MKATKALPQREKEMQALLATAEGKAELEALAARYYASGGRDRVEAEEGNGFTLYARASAGWR